MRIAMNFRDGFQGFRMRPEFSGKSTMELILSGNRTATSRDHSKPWNRHRLALGGIVEFHNREGEIAICRITSLPKPLAEIDPEEWSTKECWDTEVYHRLLKSGDYHQFEYKLIKK